MAWRVARKSPEVDLQTLQPQARIVRMWLRWNLDSFYQDMQVYGANGDAIKKQFKKQLALCGQGIISEALFTRSETPAPIWNPKLLVYCGL